jgi:hypothetical protein
VNNGWVTSASRLVVTEFEFWQQKSLADWQGFLFCAPHKITLAGRSKRRA